ncbi:MAG: tetratricopeptide repeat protein [Crocinitomicaceae bacterium]|nr:tetratricopeptide repeat protein [Crocinitomicaceae bacterium]
MTRCLKIGILFLSLQVWGQKFADVNYYLVDSLEYDNILPEYQQLINNSLSYYHNAETDIDRINAVNNIVKLCWDENVWPKYNYWVYEFTSEKLKEPQTDSVRTLMLQALAGSMYYIGWNYYVAADYEKCLSFYTECKNIYTEIGDSIGISNALDNIGNVYLARGESAIALDFYRQALVLREQLNYSIGMAASLTSIGSVYMEHGDYLNAYDELKRSLLYYEEVNYIPGISSALNNLGFIEYYFGNKEGAMNFFQRSLAIKIQIGDKQGEAISYTQIGLIYYDEGNYKEALKYYKKGLILNHEIGSKRAVAGNLQNIGMVYLAQLKFKKAISYFNKSLVLSQQIGLVNEKRIALKSLFDTHVIQGNFEAAESEISEIIAMRMHDVNVNFVILPEQKKELYFNTMVDDFMDLYAFAELRKNEHPSITALAYNNALVLKGLLLKSATAMRDAIHGSGNANLIETYTKWIALETRNC